MSRAPHRPGRAIVLVGPMGAGKSTIGPLLAERLARPFFDADDEIERDAGFSIAEIFERCGEAEFRTRERQMIARLIEGPPAVIAAGGGAFADADSRTLILARCIAVWLDADVETLAARVHAAPQRPLLRSGDPKAVLTGLAEARNPYYAEAQLRVENGASSPGEVVERIVAGLKARAA
ncbi:MAG: shikimate kinase [Sphingosinicella sp.]|uniref:shikimate kinase n=1 Tax=Sphingosinicella sp. TaxID=1917971 RepID=UPI004037A7CC